MAIRPSPSSQPAKPCPAPCNHCENQNLHRSPVLVVSCQFWAAADPSKSFKSHIKRLTFQPKCDILVIYNGKLYMALTDPSPRYCAHCGVSFRQRHPDQKFCRRWCRLQHNAAEGRSARRVWWREGRPMLDNRPIREEPAMERSYRRF